MALKAVGPRISHKTERGLVALNLDGDDAVRAAARSLLALTAGEDAVLLVERMVRGARELMIGMKRDPLFGPVVVFGVGGIFTEAHKDITLGVTPLSDRDIEGMLNGIRASVLLDDFRGLLAVPNDVDGAAYERQGYVAALMTQERPNIFTQSVANIEPGKAVFRIKPLPSVQATSLNSELVTLLMPAHL